MGVQRDPEHLAKSIDMYLRAAALFPDDEPDKQVSTELITV